MAEEQIIQDRTFYEIVLSEVLENHKIKNRVYLCENSTHFKTAWNSFKKISILNHAKVFVQEKNKSFNTGDINDIYLFTHCEYYTRLKSRIEFLEWCIENKLDIPG